MDHMLDLFKQADVDKDGSVSFDELTNLFKMAAANYPHLAEYSRQAVKKLFTEADESLFLVMSSLILDADKDNMLSTDEFAKLLKVIDSKITSLPATAQRAASQGKE